MANGEQITGKYVNILANPLSSPTYFNSYVANDALFGMAVEAADVDGDGLRGM